MSRTEIAIERVRRVLDYIHNNMDETLSLDELAQQSCWSRWQLQRVFQYETGTSVANYVRELKLSEAAERLIDSTDRVIDIALELGFGSEISFSRSFKKMFGLSPREYRKLETRTGLRKPIEFNQSLARLAQEQANFVEVKVETREGFYIKGQHDLINGLFSPNPDFAYKVPQLWAKLQPYAHLIEQQNLTTLGVANVGDASFDGSNIEYWAGVALDQSVLLPEIPAKISQQLDTLYVPKQTYAVVKHRGPVSSLPSTLEWFILRWLPMSSYRGVDGFELEVYPKDYQPLDPQAVMEYWLPIQAIKT